MLPTIYTIRENYAPRKFVTIRYIKTVHNKVHIYTLVIPAPSEEDEDLSDDDSDDDWTGGGGGGRRCKRNV